jgi:hypothetical protein
MSAEANETSKSGSPNTPSVATLKRLYALSGNICAFSGCKTRIVDGDAHVGDVCHICAASPTGPRFDERQTAAERHSEGNLILLCANHHRVIDGEPKRYTEGILKKMKADHEASVGHLSDRDAEIGAKILVSLNQHGGVISHHIETVNIVSPVIHTPAIAHLPVSAGMTFMGMDDVLAHMGPSRNERCTFDTEHFIYLRLIPNGAIKPVGMPDLLQHFRDMRILPMAHDWLGSAVRNRCGAMYYIERRPRQIAAFTQGFASGELWGMNSEVFQSQNAPVVPGEPGGRIRIVPSVAMEKLYIETLNNYVQVAQKLFEAPLPYRIEFGIKGVEGAHVTFPLVPAGRLEGPIFEEAFRRTYSLTETTQEAIDALLARYFTAFYSELVACKRKDMLAEPFMSAHGLPRDSALSEEM